MGRWEKEADAASRQFLEVGMKRSGDGGAGDKGRLATGRERIP